MLIYERNVHRKKRTLSQLGAEKIAFPPKPDGQTVIWTSISNHRVAPLLKKKMTLKCIPGYSEGNIQLNLLSYLILYLA